MYPMRMCLRAMAVSIAGALGWVGAARPVVAEGATRDLSGYSEPHVVFTVSIAIDPPSGTTVVGVEDTPPAGWSISNISNGGTWDIDLETVKWPIFMGSVPDSVTYDAVSPEEPAGSYCFTGSVSFDGPDQPIGGDVCIPIGLPTLSVWAVLAMTLLVATAGTVVLGRPRSG